MAEIPTISLGSPSQAGSAVKPVREQEKNCDMETSDVPFAEMLAMFLPVPMQELQDNSAAADTQAGSETEASHADILNAAGLSAGDTATKRLLYALMKSDRVSTKDEAPGNLSIGVPEVQQEADGTAEAANVECTADIPGAVTTSPVDTEGSASMADAIGTAGMTETEKAAGNSKAQSSEENRAAVPESAAKFAAEAGTKAPNDSETGSEAKLRSAGFQKIQPDIEVSRPDVIQMPAERESSEKVLFDGVQKPAGRLSGMSVQYTSHVGPDTEDGKSGNPVPEQQPDEPVFTLPGIQQAQEQEQFNMGTEQTVMNEKPIGHSIIEQMIDKLTLSDKANIKELTVKLKPDALGTVIIQLLEDKGITAARIITSVQETMDLINSQMPALKQQLAEQGISLHKFDVIHDGRSFQQQQADSGSNPNHQKNSGLAWHPAARISRENSMEPGISVDLQQMLHAGRINYLI